MYCALKGIPKFKGCIGTLIVQHAMKQYAGTLPIVTRYHCTFINKPNRDSVLILFEDNLIVTVKIDLSETPFEIFFINLFTCPVMAISLQKINYKRYVKTGVYKILSKRRVCVILRTISKRNDKHLPSGIGYSSLISTVPVGYSRAFACLDSVM